MVTQCNFNAEFMTEKKVWMKNDDNKFNKGAKDVFKSHLNTITFEFLHFFQISHKYEGKKKNEIIS